MAPSQLICRYCNTSFRSKRGLTQHVSKSKKCSSLQKRQLLDGPKQFELAHEYITLAPVMPVQQAQYRGQGPLAIEDLVDGSPPNWQNADDNMDFGNGHLDNDLDDALRGF